MAQTPIMAARSSRPFLNRISALVVLSAGFAVAGMAAEPPRIDRIELFQASQVTVHFDTEANRTYELQFQNPGTGNAPWTNLFVAPKIPFPNHYIVVDTRTNRARVYRLKVTP
jgi:hypothetical protein